MDMEFGRFVSAVEDEIARRQLAAKLGKHRRIVIRNRKPPPGSMALLLQQVADETVPRNKIMGKCRETAIVRARWLYMVCAADCLHKSQSEIARFLGLDHSSVGYGLSRARIILAENNERAFAIKYSRIVALWT